MLKIVARRILAHTRLLTTLAVGILIAAILLASAPIYSRAVADLALTQSLRERLLADRHMSVIWNGSGVGMPETVVARDAILASVDRRMGEFISDGLTAGSSRGFRLQRPEADTTSDEPADRAPQTTASAGDQEASSQPTGESQEPAARPSRAVLSFVQGWEQHVRLAASDSGEAGRLPQPVRIERGETGIPSAVPPLEAAVTAETASVLGFAPGDELRLVDFFDNCNRQPLTEEQLENPDLRPPPCFPNASVTISVPVVITGLVEPLSADDAYWARAPGGFPAAPVPTDQAPLVIMLVPEETLFAGYGSLLPLYPFRQTWQFQFDVERFNVGNRGDVQNALAALRADIEPLGAFVDTTLDETLSSFSARLSFNEVPLLILLLEVVGIVLFYVAMVSHMLVEQQAEEISLLRSRGATILQIVTLFALEGLAIGILAAALAPFLAGGAIALLGHTAIFSDITNGRPLPITFMPQAFGLAAGGALLALLALLIPAFVATQRTAVSQKVRLGRPAGPSLFHRYYLDVALAGLSALLIWEMERRGSIFEPSALGGLTADPLLLAAPALFTLTVAAIILRVFPLVMRVITHLATVIAGAPVALGLWQVVRNPGQYVRLTLLILMVAAVATYSASYHRTVKRSFEERELYRNGVEARVAGLGALSGLPHEEAQQALDRVPGLIAAATAYRGDGSLSATEFGVNIQFSVLGVDPRRVASPREDASLLWYRDDFSVSSLQSLMAVLQGSPGGGVGRPLPGQPTSISIWVNPTVSRSDASLWMRLSDARGRFFTVLFERLDFTGWQQLRADIAAGADLRSLTLAYPLSLHAIYFSEPTNATIAQAGSIFFDDIAVHEGDRTTVVEDFEGTRSWEMLGVPNTVEDRLSVSGETFHNGARSLELAWRVGPAPGIRGVRIADVNVPLPAVVSTSFAAATGRTVGSTVNIVVGDRIFPIIIRDVADFFPTLSPGGLGFVILNQAHLYYISKAQGADAGVAPSEVWLNLSDNPEGRALALETLRGPDYDLGEPIFTQEFIDQALADPLRTAGGSGILLLTTVALFLLTSLGFAIHLYIDAQRRKLDVAVIRAVGLSPRQVLGLLIMEYLPVLIPGLVLGTIIGTRISDVMLSFLEITESGARVLPPFVVATDWTLLLLVYFGMAAVFLGSLVAAWLYLVRMPFGQVLRLTE